MGPVTVRLGALVARLLFASALSSQQDTVVEEPVAASRFFINPPQNMDTILEQIEHNGYKCVSEAHQT